MPGNNKVSPPPKKAKKKGGSAQHVFRNIRDAVCQDAALYNVMPFTSNGGGDATFTCVLNPAGFKAAPLSGATFGAPQQVYGSSLRWLYATSQNFEYYRVLRASLIFVGNQGSTVTGRIVMFSSRDAMDISIVPQQAYASGPNFKVFDLASASSKELRIPMDIDSSWKKISSTLTSPASTAPLLSPGSAGYLIPVNTVNDLSFGAVSANAFGAPATAVLGTFFVDYDVEFKGPLSSPQNA